MNFPKIPRGPFTIGINGMVMDSVLATFVEKWLPAYEVVITSGYRSPDENEAAGGAQYSAHQYNLARDFALKDSSGNFVDKDRLKRIYEEFIKPNWAGYSSYNPPKTGSTGWIHVNLDRSITNYTKTADLVLTGASVFLLIRKLIKKGKGE